MEISSIERKEYEKLPKIENVINRNEEMVLNLQNSGIKKLQKNLRSSKKNNKIFDIVAISISYLAVLYIISSLFD